jgi:hypothetical protein
MTTGSRWSALQAIDKAPALEGDSMMTRAAFAIVLSLGVLLGVRARAITSGQIDVNNTYENVGAFLVTARAGHPAGIPEGTVVGNCTGTLIEERVALLAAHCVALAVARLPPFLRLVVSFSHDNPRDTATWVDVAAVTVHPSFPWQTCTPGNPPGPCPADENGNQIPSLTPGIFDIGLVVLATPVQEIKPAKLARPGFLEQNVAQGARMTVVGYGETDPNPDGIPLPLEQWDGLRKYGTSTMLDAYNTEWTRFNRDPSGTCFGDSGGPTFFLNRVVAVTSDGGAHCDTFDHRSRVDAQSVRDWIESVIASLGPLSPLVQ